MTYTNHALEQFLNFIKEITDKIIRIGGKKSEVDLQRFSLFNRLREEKINYGK